MSVHFPIFAANVHHLEFVLPHHAFNRARGGVIVFGVAFGIIHHFYITFNNKINKLANWHAGINSYRLRA